MNDTTDRNPQRVIYPTIAPNRKQRKGGLKAQRAFEELLQHDQPDRKRKRAKRRAEKLARKKQR